jgi:Tfp pilus assembly protein PilO
MIIAATGWSDAAVAIAGVFFVTAFVCVLIWQGFATGRSRMAASRETTYRQLAEELRDSQARTAAAVEQTSADVADMRVRMTELERLLKEVE